MIIVPPSTMNDPVVLLLDGEMAGEAILPRAWKAMLRTSASPTIAPELAGTRDTRARQRRTLLCIPPITAL